MSALLAGAGLRTAALAGSIRQYWVAAAGPMASLPNDCQQYLAREGSRPYCSAQPSGQRLGDFPGASYKLPATVWINYDWSISHCILRGDNAPISV